MDLGSCRQYRRQRDRGLYVCWTRKIFSHRDSFSRADYSIWQFCKDLQFPTRCLKIISNFSTVPYEPSYIPGPTIYWLLRKLSSTKGTEYLVLPIKQYYGDAGMIHNFAALTIPLNILCCVSGCDQCAFFAASDKRRWKTLTILWSSLTG